MNTVQALILGLVQGLTEFIPVSSSGHLIIAHHLLGAEQAGLTFDVALHIGTLLALVLFFYRDIAKLTLSLISSREDSRLAWLLVLATIPAIITGIALQSLAESSFRSVGLVSINLIVMAFLMLMAENYGRRFTKKTELHNVKRRQALLMGIAQAAAIIPGISRSGSTITAGVFSGLDRVSATRFSFLLGIPITFGAALKVLLSNNALQEISTNSVLFFIGAGTSFLSGLFAIRFMLRFVAGHSLHFFAYYRIVLGVVSLVLINIF